MGCVLPSAQVSLASEHCGDDHCFNWAPIADDFSQGRLCVGYNHLARKSGWARENGDYRNSRLNHDSEEFPAAEGPYAVMLLQLEK